NKWDLGPLAERTRAELESWLALSRLEPGAWRPPVIGASGETGEGVAELGAAIEQHRAPLPPGGPELRRAPGPAPRAPQLVGGRCGPWGGERGGGRAEIGRLCAETPGTALDAFNALAKRAGLPS